MSYIVRDDRDGLLVISSEHTNQNRTPVWLKRHTITYLELKHLSMGPHLGEEPQARHDPVIEIDELWLR